MDEFYVEKQADETGAHRVHRETCKELPAKDEIQLLGVRSNPQAPLNEAANWYGKSTHCPTCITM